MRVSEIGAQRDRVSRDLGSGAVAAFERTNREGVPLIPPAELAALFRQPDYSGNGRSGALFPGGSRERVRIGGGIIRGY